MGKLKTQKFCCKTCRGGKGERNRPSQRRVPWRGHRVLECTQTHPPGNQHLKRHNSLVGSEGSVRKWDKSQASGIVPSPTPPPQTAPQHSKEQIPKSSPIRLQCNMCTETKKYGPNCWAPLCVVSETVALQEQALKGAVSLPGKSGHNAGGRHDSILTPRVPWELGLKCTFLYFEGSSAQQ